MVIYLCILLVLVRSFLISNSFEQNIIQLTCNFQSLSFGKPEGRGRGCLGLEVIGIRIQRRQKGDQDIDDITQRRDDMNLIFKR